MRAPARAALATALRHWLPGTRWFAVPGEPDRVHVASAVPLGGAGTDADPLLLHCVVEATSAGVTESYQVPLGLRDTAAGVPAGHLVGGVDGNVVVDATVDPAATTRLLDLVAAGAEVDGLEFAPEPGAAPCGGLAGRPVGVEQSNTSLVYGDRYILKLYRRLVPGARAELVLHRALAGVGARHIAAPLGSITLDVAGEPVLLGFLQQFLPGAPDGWALATAAVAAGTGFTTEARLLGQAVGETHADLRRALGTGRGGPERVAELVAWLHTGLDRVAATVPEVRDRTAAVGAVYDEVTRLDELAVQAVHGDLHLGQVLRTARDWVLIDFEGEPSAPAEERGAFWPAARDVAGMLRSFDYAAAHSGSGRGAAEWADRARAGFLDGYAGPGSRPGAEAELLLRALELQKAVYEVGYEYANRPDWLPIPLAAVDRLTREDR